MTYTFEAWRSGKPLPKRGWDAADAVADGWTKNDLDGFMRATAKPWASPEQVEEPAKTLPEMVPDPEPFAHAGPHTVTEARTTQQEKPEPATVTDIRTRHTVKADDGWMLHLVCGEEGKIKPGATKNWALFLENHPVMTGVFAFDAFKLRVMLMRQPPWAQVGSTWEPRPVQDRDYSEAVMWLEALHMTPKASNIAAVIQTVAEHSSFDRLRSYLEELVWDKRPRIDQWLTYYMGVEDGEYARAVGKRWLVSSVARGLKPGCKVDTMPILEGPQGARKSTAIRVLYGDEFFTDELSDIGSKDAMMELQGVWGLEVAEMHRFSAAETNAVKKFLTRQTDRFRPPYGRTVIEAPRRVVLNGTINPEGNGYLRDPTGARRFWPLTVGKIAIDDIAADRDQLWAEAVALYKAGVPWWVQEDEQRAVEAEQEKRTDIDVWQSLIVSGVKARSSVSQWELLKMVGVQEKDAGWQQSQRIGRIMRKLGWASIRDRSNGDDRTVYKNPALLDLDDGKGDW